MRFTVRRRWLAAVLLAGAGALWLAGGELPPRELLAQRLAALGPAALPAGALLFAAASLLGTPGSLLVASSVWVFGFGRGAAVAGVGAVLSAAAAFWLARRLGRERVLDWLAERRRWRRLDEEIGRRGGWVVLALRLLPSLPFTLLNYLLGLTRVRFDAYIVATAAGILPHLVLFAWAAEQLLPAAGGPPPWQRPGFWWAVALVAGLLGLLPLVIRLGGRHGNNRWLLLLARLR